MLEFEFQICHAYNDEHTYTRTYHLAGSIGPALCALIYEVHSYCATDSHRIAARVKVKYDGAWTRVD